VAIRLDRRAVAVGLALAWIASRAYLFKLVRWSSFPPGDILYYVRSLQHFPAAGLAGFMPEYPTPVAAGLRALWLLTGSNKVVFTFAFIAAMLICDAFFTIVLWRYARREKRVAATMTWIIIVPLLGSLTYLRFDLVPAMLAGAAVLIFARRPAMSGALVGLGAAIKLTPALLVLPLLGGRESWKRVGGGFVAVGGSLAVLSLLFGGGCNRLVSPLAFQSTRGLQIEAIAATIPMLLWAGGATGYHVKLSGISHSWEITGPMVANMLTLSSVAFAVGLVFIAWLGYRVVRNRVVEPGVVALLTIVMMSILIVTNKVLSPQYILWIAGPLAALVAVNRPPSEVHEPSLTPFAERNIVLGLGVIAVLTQLVYPVLYTQATRTLNDTFAAITVLALRNACLLAFTGVTCVLAVRATRRVPVSAPIPAEPEGAAA
jgi:hypothetical protein